MDEREECRMHNAKPDGGRKPNGEDSQEGSKAEHEGEDIPKTLKLDNGNKYYGSMSTWILAITMLGILWQAFEMNRNVHEQAKFNDSGLRPYLAVDPSYEMPHIQDSLLIVTSSFANYGRTPAYNTVLVGRPTSTEAYPDSLLRALIEQDEDLTEAITYPGQPGITFTGESILRDPSSFAALSGVTIDSLIAHSGPLFYHVYVEYESAWERKYYLRCSFKYVGGTKWSTIFASESASYE